MTLNSSNIVRWRCHRGMLELDLILLPFYDACYENLPEEDKVLFERLLESQDPELYDWFLGQSLPTDDDLATMVGRIREYNQTTN
ncbi:MAG: succinate dehydrogenase assembly factor 2 [Proteobacteria bacterium]|nr:succinate dehydrogenase assembly factor 2 [Pseudomonadota bacterium]